MKHVGDITKLNGFELEPVDCVIGGSPCQDLSCAGQRAGLAGERSSLFLQQIRLVKELRKADEARGRTNEFIRPRYMVWENVPGAFSSNGGKDFKAVLEETIRIIKPDAPNIPLPEKWPMADCWMGDGWSIAYRVHDSQFWGVPQRRRRIALVADFGGHSAPEILFERKGLCRNFTEGGAQREAATDGTGGGSDCTVYTLQGNGIDRADTAGCHGKGWNDGVSYTLNTIDRHAVYDARGNGDGEVCSTITGDHENRVSDYTSIVLSMHQNQQGYISTSDKTHTLSTNGNATGRNAPVIAAVDCRNGTENEDINGTLQAKESGGSSLNLNNVIRVMKKVRRLTPTECDRLQGFPDGWTDIGEWKDSKGRVHKESDTPRYRALGNSIALPFWRWLLKRISAQYYTAPTMGSLFDVIGGFSYLWESINGAMTVRWASEIEEFPIAVTKRHFIQE